MRLGDPDPTRGQSSIRAAHDSASITIANNLWRKSAESKVSLKNRRQSIATQRDLTAYLIEVKLCPCLISALDAAAVLKFFRVGAAFEPVRYPGATWSGVVCLCLSVRESSDSAHADEHTDSANTVAAFKFA